MTGLRRTPRIGKVLAAGALIGLAGCHQVPSRPGAPSPLGFGNEPKGGGTTITPAQEADVQISMGRVAEQQGNLDQAMAAYRAALDRDRRRADAYARLAVLHDKQGKFRESAELYRKALALRPGDPDIFCDMGYSFYLQRRWAEAEMNLRQSIAINPEHRRAHNNLALLLVRDSRLGDALAEFGKAGSDPVQAHMNLAFALTIDQRWESARAEYQRALALDPSSQLAKARLDELNKLLAKREPAAAPAPDGAGRNPALLTTATAAPPARRGPDGPTATATATATATPPQSAPSGARRDPALLSTAAVSPSPPQGYRPRTRVAIPSLPAKDDAMQRIWATADSASGAPSPPRSDARARNTAPTAPPQRRDPHPQPAAAPPDDSSTLPLLAIDSPRPTQAGTRGPDRASIPPPQSFEALQTARPDAHPPAVSTPIAPPRRTPTPRTATPGAAPTSNPDPVGIDPTRNSTIGP
jgi:Tfp pilus assembly protein PilF